jgi:uncharacterized protein
MFFTPWTILILIAFGLSLWAQFRVKGTFNKYMKVSAASGLTGAEAARKMLNDNGLYNVPIECIRGPLTDHYDPISKVVRLSEHVYYGNSVASLSVACHEIGHVIQDKVKYPMLVARHRLFPVVNFSSGIAPLLLLGGFFFKIPGLLLVGIIAFSAAVAFQIITLPVEFNASRRAKDYMIRLGLISNNEERAARKVLGAAALTYVAATLMSVLQLAEYLWMFTNSNDED